MKFAPAELEEYISATQLEERIKEIGQQITKDYQGKDLVVIGVLNGCILFYSDLIRHIELPITCDFLGLSSYGSETTSSGNVQLTYPLPSDLEKSHVLVVEDIVDTGNSMNFLWSQLQRQNPSTLQLCSLLSKPSRRQVDVQIDHL